MRAAGMQVLTEQVEARRPGVTIWGKGDKAHEGRTSGHNEDDTAGVKAEDQDTDDTAEHRALDFKVDQYFTHADGDQLVHDLVTDEDNQRRMIYVNWGRQQWHRKNGWRPVPNDDDPHDGHVHVSGEADADANTAPWNLSNWDNDIQEEGFMFVKVAGPENPAVFVPRGDGYAHLTSNDALSAALTAGYKLIEVPSMKDIEALLGPEYKPAPPLALTDEQISQIAREVAAQVFPAVAQAQRASATVLDEAAGAGTSS